MNKEAKGHSGKAHAPRFPLGRLVSTPGALELMRERNVLPIELLTRHVSGDWGDMCAEDLEINEEALRHGHRLFSAYDLPSEQGHDASTAGRSVVQSRKDRIWVITEADRSVTTLLLPSEY